MKTKYKVNKLENMRGKFRIEGPTLHNTPALAMPDEVFMVTPDDIKLKGGER